MFKTISPVPEFETLLRQPREFLDLKSSTEVDPLQVLRSGN